MNDTIIKVSAPGKIVLCGEHAVLHGYSAISMAINQRLYVEFFKIDNDNIEIVSKIGKECFSKQEIQNYNEFKIPKWCKMIVFLFKQYNVFGVRIEITSNIEDYGFGSSGAIFSCVSCGLQMIKNNKNFGKSTLLKNTLKLYFQYFNKNDFRPSGVDIATNIIGGLIYYNPLDFVVKNIDGDIFKNYNIFAIWTGYKTQTCVAKKIADNAVGSVGIYENIGNIVDEVYFLSKEKKMPEMFDKLNENQYLLQKLNLVDEDINNILKQCSQQNIVCKISGSGLGDCVVAICEKKKILKINGYVVKKIEIDFEGIMYDFE